MKKYLLLLILAISTTLAFSQTNKQKAEHYLKDRGELVFTFTANNLNEVQELAKIVSFDHGQDPSNPFVIRAIANEKEFQKFLDYNLPYTVDAEKNEPKKVQMYDPLLHESSQNRVYPLTFPLNAYPTYAQYSSQMTAFATDNPSIAQLVNIGSSVNGKELLFIKLSDNVGTHEQEPRLLLTSSMHGDEIAGYPMMLSLIDFLISVYNDTGHARHAEIKNLIDNSEIWINPMANPDGTFFGDWTNYADVSGARRANANNIDLNRNYPDPDTGTSATAEAETIAFKNMADTYHFVIAANFHGGAEVVNYPWDVWAHPTAHADEVWYEYIGVEYATFAQNNSPAGYFTDDPDGGSPGVTHGATWYAISGGRQDYMNYYKQCRELTVELSSTKIIPTNQIQNHWDYNRDALVDFLKEGTYGFRGLVKDANTGNPIQAKITIVGHDDANGSWVNTELPIGDYYRPIKAGTYDILYTADCYAPFTLTNQTITDLQTVNLPDVLLVPAGTPSNLGTSSITDVSATLNWTGSPTSTYDIRYRVSGTATWTNTTSTTESVAISGLTANTQYEFQVKGTCGGTPSAYSASSTFTTLAVNYCASNGQSTVDEYIGNVTLGTINNTSTAGTTSTGYSDYTASPTATQTTDLDIDATTPPTISVTKFWPGTAYSEGVSVWIDFNQDGDFLDAGEQLFTSPANQTTPVSGPVNIPSLVPAGITKLGTTRMRVSMKYNGIPTSCESFGFGEVEDYTVNIISSVLGVDSVSAILNTISIYPNPVNEQLFVNTPSSIILLDYKISNTIGQEVLRDKFINTNKINCSSLHSGIYFLSINTDKGMITKKIIIQ